VAAVAAICVACFVHRWEMSQGAGALGTGSSLLGKGWQCSTSDERSMGCSFEVNQGKRVAEWAVDRRSGRTCGRFSGDAHPKREKVERRNRGERRGASW
jgi:hypothetical protein